MIELVSVRTLNGMLKSGNGTITTVAPVYNTSSFSSTLNIAEGISNPRFGSGGNSGIARNAKSYSIEIRAVPVFEVLVFR